MLLFYLKNTLMKNYIKKYNTVFVVIVLIFCNLGYAQDITDSNYKELKQKELEILNQTTKQTTITTKQTSSSSVFIQQIGYKNTIQTEIDASYSQIQIEQRGEYNQVEIREISKEITKTIRQIGRDNRIGDFSIDSEVITNLELNQSGNNLIFERQGINELSKNMKFSMSGNNKTIIIRSF